MACKYGSPTFFSRKRYTKIRTQISDGSSGWKPVNDWALSQSFPASGDGSPPALWLDSITQTGRVASPATVGNAITLNPTTFHGVLKANCVNANSQYTAITRNRIDAITNPQGGITTITYADPECVPGVKMPANPESNTLSCYPVYWTPGRCHGAGPGLVQQVPGHRRARRRTLSEADEVALLLPACCTGPIPPPDERIGQLLASALVAAGLVGYPARWWHWSYGDRFWAWTTQAPHARYGPLPGHPR
ncbi:hypothetical protein [Amycolatopsis sp. NPDC051128]|uniref:hypothetical protein n=1 Tax=Amycolatopsis sp. NPDC051128 TaxID=3155412 RepID=UPI0034265D59